MNSWNNATSLAYNLKIYNVIDDKLQNKVYELMELPEFYEDINMLISDFDNEFNHEWQAGLNGRSGGYLVLYKGGIKDNRIYTQPGITITDAEVPSEVKKAFRQLAVDIVKTAEFMAKNYTIEEQEIECLKTVKVLSYNN